jgi:hypothetical protein
MAVAEMEAEVELLQDLKALVDQMKWGVSNGKNYNIHS